MSGPTRATGGGATAETWILANPGARAGSEVRRRIERSLAARSDRPVRWCTPEHLEVPDEGSELPVRWIAVGGDGTVNLALSRLRDLPGGVPLGIVPAGTGNNLARGLGIPVDPAHSIPLALDGTEVRRIDAALVTESDSGRTALLAQVGGLGFPAEVAADYDRWRHRFPTRPFLRLLGDRSYRLLALRRLVATRRHQVRGRFTVDGDAIESTFLGLFVTNEGSIGGDFHPSPGARPDDGSLELVVLVAPRFRDARRLYRELTAGTHLDRAEAGQTASILVRSFSERLDIELDPPGPFLIDGDLPFAGGRFTLEVLPGRFSVVVPARPS